MPTSTRAFSAALALRRVFLAPISSPLLPQSCTTLSTPNLQQQHHQQHRFFRVPNAPAKRRLPRDDEIRAPYVYLIGEDGKLPRDRNGELEPPWRTAELLSRLDRQKEVLMAMSMPTKDENRYDTSAETGSESAPSGNGGLAYPLCRVFAKSALLEATKAKSTNKTKNPAATVKKVELNWAIDGHDLTHRLERVKEFLGKGWRVEVMLAPKRKGRKASVEETGVLLGRVRGVVGEVEGAKEWKGMEGEAGKAAVLHFEGPRG